MKIIVYLVLLNYLITTIIQINFDHLGLAKIRSIRLSEFIQLEIHWVRLQDFCLNLKFEQSVMSEFKSRSSSGLSIRVRVVQVFESFRV